MTKPDDRHGPLTTESWSVDSLARSKGIDTGQFSYHGQGETSRGTLGEDMCVFYFFILGIPLFLWAGAVSGWNDTFILCACCMLVGVYLRLREHVILCLPFLFIGILGIVAFFLGWV